MADGFAALCFLRSEMWRDRTMPARFCPDDRRSVQVWTRPREFGRSDIFGARNAVQCGQAMVEIQPIRVELEREGDGRVLAAVPDLPGVMAYGSCEEEAVRKVKAIALQVLADRIESGEEVPAPLKALFAA